MLVACSCSPAWVSESWILYISSTYVCGAGPVCSQKHRNGFTFSQNNAYQSKLFGDHLSVGVAEISKAVLGQVLDMYSFFELGMIMMMIISIKHSGGLWAKMRLSSISISIYYYTGKLTPRITFDRQTPNLSSPPTIINDVTRSLQSSVTPY